MYPEAPPGSTPVTQLHVPDAESNVVPLRERPDRLDALRKIARKLRSAPDAEETLQYVIDQACLCTGSHAGMLTVSVPQQRQVVYGRALGAGPYISVQLRVGGPTFGEIVLTRMSDASEYESEDETFVELVAEYVAKAISALRMGTVLSRDAQDFVDRVTEEMRGSLASADNLIGTVVRGEAGVLTAEATQYLRSAAADTGRLLRTLNDLMAIAHLRPPHLRELESVAVAPWIKRVAEQYGDLARAKDLVLEVIEPDTPMIVKGVPEHLDTMLMHMVDNAVKFSEPGGRVEISAGMFEGMVRVTVTDTGIGFDAADAPRMVDCFTRAINAEAARIPGMGVGLFLANEIIKNHSGRLWLETVRDKGTQAYAVLPPAHQDPI